MRHIKSFMLFESMHSESDVRDAAWLYFLVYPYGESGMKQESWDKDQRVGIRFADSMARWMKAGVVMLTGGKYTADEEAARSVLYDVFGRYNTRAEAESAGQDLRQYDVPGLHGYRISGLPLDIFDRDEEAGNRGHGREERLDRDDYYTIGKWFEKYQRNAHGWWTRLNRYLGMEGELFPKKDEYVLYRGIMVREGQIGDGEYFMDSGMSWTWSPSTARGFAKGRDNWTSSNELKGDQRGLVLSHEFDPREILLDTNFVKNISVDFPDEFEVVVQPRKRKVKIHEILYPNEAH
jgi:hypothetical protein